MPNIVGIGNSQAPTNAMLGGLAYKDSVGEIDLGKIKARTGDTAQALFVYDTRKDSDGGVWRHRTQNLSWYNEGASAKRGARKEFPAVAVIVVTEDDSRAIHIYDGDDPNLPMWMVIDTTDTQWPLTEFSSVTALNGIIALGSKSNEQPNYETRNRLDLYYFISDKIVSSGGSSGGSYYGTVQGLVNRRTHATNRGSSTGRSVYNLVNLRVNDVAMTVLPNAPIDTSTGLPTPTIAVATEGGASIIKDDGTTVIEMRPTGSSVPQAKEIYFTKSNKIALTHGSNWVYYYQIPSSTVTATYWNGLAGYIGRFTDTQRNYSTSANPGIPINVGTSGITNFIEDRAVGHTNGVEIIDINEEGSFYLAMHCGISTDFNTGWQLGDIKGAFLSDTDDTNITGTELIGNPGPFSNTTGWVADNGFVISESGNRLRIDSNGNGASYFGAYYAFTTVVGKKYALSVNIHSQNAGTVVRLSGSGTYFTQTSLGLGTHAFYFTSDQASTTVRIGSNVGAGSNRVQEIISVNVREVEEDRSVNDKGLQVFGTITKSPVATGAELVTYSGFNGSNYLRQPYNSNLNFGTGDFSIIVWVKKSSFSTNHYIIDRAKTAPWGGGTGRSYFIINSGGYHRYKLSGGAEQTGNVTTMPTGVFTQIGFVRRSGAMEFYMNGQLVQTITGSNASASFDDGVTDQTLTVNRYANGFAFDYTFDGMALLRISGDAPSANQMKKIYDDEKCLFHENTKCTLHGTSNSVVTLAHDDTTDIIHAGTSAGRSEFQGLNRINNTTTAVTTAISASDGLVAEQ